MKRSTRYIKKALVTFLVVLMNINAFAAVVGDNDGAAFITKAEFDSLKNDFQSQLDRYNSSIDNKIDGAIATYLSGIKVLKGNTMNILMGNKSDYTIRNGALENDYKCPDLDMAIAFDKMQWGSHLSLPGWRASWMVSGIPWSVANSQGWSSSGGRLDGYYNAKMIHGWAFANYERTDAKNLKNVVKNEGGVSNLVSDTVPLIWRGRATNKVEKWTMSAIWDISNERGQSMSSSDPAWLNEAYTNKIVFGKALKLNVNGKLEPANTKNSTVWNPTMRWYYNSNNFTWSIHSDNKMYTTVVPTVNYEANGDDKTWQYENLGTWKDDVDIECEIEDCESYAYYSTLATSSTADWFGNIQTNGELYGFWSGVEFVTYWQGSDGGGKPSTPTGFKVGQNVLWADGETEGSSGNFTIPQLGLLPFIPKANHIYQYYNTLKDSDGNLVPNVTLNQGMPLCAVTANEQITWSLEFDKITAKNVTGDLEAVLVLSYVPFTSKQNILNNNDYVEISGYEKGVTWPQTTDKKLKISFTADRNGYVYAKWYPKLPSTFNVDTVEWDATLNINKSGTYVSEKE